MKRTDSQDMCKKIKQQTNTKMPYLADLSDKKYVTNERSNIISCLAIHIFLQNVEMEFFIFIRKVYWLHLLLNQKHWKCIHKTNYYVSNSIYWQKLVWLQGRKSMGSFGKIIHGIKKPYCDKCQDQIGMSKQFTRYLSNVNFKEKRNTVCLLSEE